MIVPEKVCTRCGGKKPRTIEFFARHSQMGDGLRPDCRQCSTAQQRAKYRRTRSDPHTRARELAYREANRKRERARAKAWYESNPQEAAAARRRNHIKRYGLTPEGYEAILRSQAGRCAVCRSPEPHGAGRWHIDHDHSCCDWDANKRKLCGQCVRGLLCHRCNAHILPVVENVEILRQAQAYLRERPAQRVLSRRAKAAETPQPWEVTEVRIAEPKSVL